MFEKVLLITADGALVDEVVIPHFRPAASVLVWGQRCFVLAPDVDGRTTYQEGMMWPVLPQEQYQKLGL